MDADWYAFCQAIYKGIEGREWEELHHHYRDMSKAARAKKPSEKAKRCGFVEEHLKDPIIALDKALKCVENQCQG